MFTSCIILTIFEHYKYFYDSKANQAKFLTSIDVAFNDADVKSHYDLSNSERQYCKGT